MKHDESNLNISVVPTDYLSKFDSDLQEIKSLLREKTEQEINEQWLTSQQARRILGVCPKTWQVYRDQRKIGFSQFGNKIYVKRADLEAFMKKNYIESIS